MSDHVYITHITFPDKQHQYIEVHFTHIILVDKHRQYMWELYLAMNTILPDKQHQFMGDITFDHVHITHIILADNQDQYMWISYLAMNTSPTYSFLTNTTSILRRLHQAM